MCVFEVLFEPVIFIRPLISRYIHSNYCTNLSQQKHLEHPGDHDHCAPSLDFPEIYRFSYIQNRFIGLQHTQRVLFLVFKVTSSKCPAWFPTAFSATCGALTVPLEVLRCLRCLRFRRCPTGRWPSRRARWHAMGVVSPRNWVWRNMAEIPRLFGVYRGVRCRVSTGWLRKNQIII